MKFDVCATLYIFRLETINEYLWYNHRLCSLVSLSSTHKLNILIFTLTMTKQTTGLVSCQKKDTAIHEIKYSQFKILSSIRPRLSIAKHNVPQSTVHLQMRANFQRLLLHSIIS